MSCTQKNCARADNKTPTAGDVAAMQAAGIDLLNYLLDVARGGLPTQVTRLINVTTFQTAAVKELADRIATLIAENEYLKKITSDVVPARFQVLNDTLEIAFGPELSYTLRVPVATVAARDQLVSQLLQAAHTLQPQHSELCALLTAQQTFDFMS
jgi:hypothetical protein